MLRRLAALWLIAALATVASVQAAPLEVDAAFTHADLDRQLVLLEDPTGALAFEQVRARSDFAAPGPKGANLGFTGSAWWARVDLRIPAPAGKPRVRVIGANFPNGQAPDSDKFVYKMRWLDALREWVRAELAAHPRLVLLGDYNITFDDLDVWDPVGLAGTIHCTDEERTHLKALIDLGLSDAFRLFPQPEKSFSWWDYRMLGYQKNRGLRIDHILVSEALRPLVKACTIDRVPRKWDKPSDHTPVVVDLLQA